MYENKIIESIPLKYINPNPEQPRKYFDPDSLEALAKSILRYGVINPITVKKINDKNYELISGERRFRASVLAGLSSIPSIVVSNSDAYAVMSLLENLQREELSFFEVAESYKSLIRSRDMTKEEIARKVGKSEEAVSKKLRLLSLGARVRRLIRDYRLSEEYAEELLHINNDNDREDAVKTIYREGMSINQAREFIRNYVRDKNGDDNRRIHSIKDLKIFYNTVKQALNIMKKSGIDAHMEEKKLKDAVEYVIVIRN